jgi:hypothetical protein
MSSIGLHLSQIRLLADAATRWGTERKRTFRGREYYSLLWVVSNWITFF